MQLGEVVAGRLPHRHGVGVRPVQALHTGRGPLALPVADRGEEERPAARRAHDTGPMYRAYNTAPSSVSTTRVSNAPPGWY